MFNYGCRLHKKKIYKRESIPSCNDSDGPDLIVTRINQFFMDLVSIYFCQSPNQTNMIKKKKRVGLGRVYVRNCYNQNMKAQWTWIGRPSEKGLRRWHQLSTPHENIVATSTKDVNVADGWSKMV